MSLAQTLVEGAIEVRQRGLDPDTARIAREAVSDCMACMLAAAGHPVVQSVERACLAAATVSASDVGAWLPFTGRRTMSALDQALIGGTQAHALDFDDNHFPAIVHASAVVIPALWASAGLTPLSERGLVEAFGIALRAQRTLFASWGDQHYEMGWHATSTIGTISAALACAAAMGLTREELFAAVSISTSSASGSRAQFGSTLKPVHAGLAAQSGVRSALLARSGIAGIADPFAGPLGVSRLFSSSTASDHRHDGSLPAGILLPKLYPCCMSAHMGIEAVLELKRVFGAELLQAAGFVFTMPAFMVANLPYRHPSTPEQARFSMHHAAAIALVHCAPTLAHFEEPYLTREDVHSLRSRVRLLVCEDRHASEDRPWGSAGVTLKAVFADGRQPSARVHAPAGAPERPLTDRQRKDKFIACATSILEPASAEQLWMALERFGDGERSARSVLGLLDALAERSSVGAT